MQSRKLNPERKPSLKKHSSTQGAISEISGPYRDIIKSLEQKHTQQTLPKLISSITSFLAEWNQQSLQFQTTHPKQSILKGLITQIQNNSPSSSIKLKISRTGLEIVYKMNVQQLIKFDNKEGPQYQKNIEVVSFLKSFLDCITKVSQDTKNDKSVAESGILKIIFQLLASIHPVFAAWVQKLQRKLPQTLQLKNSIKRTEQLPIVERPKSRQKLSSLSKRDGTKPIISILSSNMSNKQQNKTELVEDITLGLLTIVKNCGANVELKKKILEQQCLSLLKKYVQVWDDKNITAMGHKMLIQITSTHRHLAAQQKSFKAFLVSRTVEQWIRLIQEFPTSKEIILNLLRLFSKLSTIQECCQILDSRQLCIRNLISFFATYKTDIYIIIRVSFIFANMTSYLVDIRNKMYFKYNAFGDIYQCFDYYITSELRGKGDIDKMGISTMAWDYQVMKKESDIEALVKIIRLIANILTVNEIGMDIYLNKGIQFRDLVKKLKILLEKKASIESNPDLIICGLSCLANSLFYDKQVLMSNIDHKNTKIQIIGLLANFIVQAQNEEVCVQGLRVLSNLSRSKQFIKAIIQNQLHQATLILLQSSSKQVVYYSMGVLINLLVDTDFKNQYQQRIVRAVLDILNECNNEDFDIITICSKCISNVAKGLVGPLVKQIQQTMQKLGARCDSLMIRPSSAKDTLQESRKMINMVINDLTTDPYVCKISDCGRRFGSEVELKAHLQRRHKL